MLTETFTREDGWTEKQMALESTSTKMVPCIVETGSMTSITEKELKLGTMAPSSTRVTFKKQRNQEKEDLNSTEITTKVTLKTDNSKVKANTISRILAKSTTENSMRIILLATESCCGQTTLVTKESS